MKRVVTVGPRMALASITDACYGLIACLQRSNVPRYRLYYLLRAYLAFHLQLSC